MAVVLAGYGVSGEDEHLEVCGIPILEVGGVIVRASIDGHAKLVSGPGSGFVGEYLSRVKYCNVTVVCKVAPEQKPISQCVVQVLIRLEMQNPVSSMSMDRLCASGVESYWDLLPNSIYPDDEVRV